MKRKSYFAVAMLSACMLLSAGCGDADSKNDVTGGTEALEQSAREAFEYEADEYVALGEYKNLKVKCPVAEVSRDDIEMEIEYLIEENRQYNEIKDRGIQDGDYVNIDFAGKADGKEFDGGSSQGYEFTMGEGEFFEDFEKNLLGKKAGEEFTFQTAFPEDYDEGELSGKAVEFQVTINSISEAVMPEYNDEFVKTATEYDTVQAYEAALMEELKASAQDDAMNQAGEDALKAAVANAKISGYPQALYDVCYSSTLKDYQDYAEMAGMELSEIIEDESDIEQEVLELVNEILVSQAIADKEGFAITDENYDAEVQAMAEEYEYDSADAFLAEFGEVYVRSNLIRDKAIDFLYANASVQEVPAEEYYVEDTE